MMEFSWLIDIAESDKEALSHETVGFHKIASTESILIGKWEIFHTNY